MSPIRVLLCGTNYGRNYLLAVKRRPDRFQLAGILGRGSDRSAELADQTGVPLYTSPDAIDGSVELACAALGRQGNDVVLALLRRGISVLCEHPQSWDFLAEALSTAERSKAVFHLNGHFLKLDPARTFINVCREHRAKEHAQFLTLETSGRALYGAIDIVRAAIGPFGEPALARVHDGFPFTLVTGRIGETPLTLAVQRSHHPGEGALPDASRHYLLDQRITVGFPSGVLTLQSVAGPVIWTENFGGSPQLAGPMWSVMTPCAPEPKQFNDWRTAANLESLLQIADSMDGAPPPEEQAPARILDVARVCDRIKKAVFTPMEPCSPAAS